YQTLSKTDDGREPILTAGFIHEVSNFIDSYPSD
ncbi:unnamed protein product, partial [Rotaria sordida]